MLTERSSCEICGNRWFKPLLTLEQREIVRCRSCSYTFAAAYNPDVLDDYYRQDYYPGADDPRIKDWIDQNMPVWRGLVRDLRRFEPSVKSVLDIGAGSGGFLLALREALPDTELAAIESCRPAREHLLKLLPELTLPVNDVAGLNNIPRSYACITMLQCLEHVPEPLQVCRDIVQRLEPAGILLVSVPNRLSYEVLTGAAASSLCYREHTHLQFFDRKSLRRLLQKAGFRNIKRLTGFGGAQYHGLPAVIQYFCRLAGISTELRYAAWR